MSGLDPFQVLYAAASGPALPLPPELAALYGPLRLPDPAGRPLVIANFVTTLDGVVDLNLPGRRGGGPISGHDAHDRMVMGLLRAVADAVVVGAGTLRASSGHTWTAEGAFPPLAGAYGRLRAALGKPASPLNVVVSAGGAVDPALAIFRSGQVPALVVTTEAGRQRLRAAGLPEWVRLAVAGCAGRLDAGAILEAIRGAGAGGVILLEGGPHLMGPFFAERRLDELFLTLAPQVAGREAAERPGLVEGRELAPELPRWAELADVRRAGGHLFLRYAFPVDG